jgi:hypothetical protein
MGKRMLVLVQAPAIDIVSHISVIPAMMPSWNRCRVGSCGNMLLRKRIVMKGDLGRARREEE